jgi:hypothetical protein
MIKKIYLLSFLIIISCKKADSYDSYFKTKIDAKISNEKCNFKLDSIQLGHVSSSYTGDLCYLNDQILFIDYRFCWAYIFDYNGKLIDKKLGQGKNVDEIDISHITRFDNLENGNFIFYGHANDAHVFDKNWKKLKESHINWNGSVDYGYGRDIKNPEPDEPTIYSMDFVNPKIKHFKNKSYVPIYSEHSDFNGFTNDEYYLNGRIIAEINFDSLYNIEVTRLLGRRTPELLKNKYLPHHSSFDFDVDSKGNFYVAHEIDSAIYVYDQDFKLKRGFGVAGSNMDTKYNTLDTFDVNKYRQLLFIDRPNKGYYKAIKKIEEQHIIFRTYSRKNNKDGLQIYKNEMLTADLEVPKNFEVRHYKDGYYYSNAFIDEENEIIKIYKFKLTK